LLPVQDVRCALGPHDRDLRCGPGDVHVSAEMLGAHDDVGAAECLADDDGDLGHAGLCGGIDELGAAPDDSVPFLVGTGKEAGDIDEGDDGNVERVAGPDEPRGLLRGVDMEAAGELGRLVTNDADGTTLDPPEADDDIRCKKWLYF